MKIGILAVQGDFELHAKMLQNLGVEAKYVKKVGDLSDCDGLIFPGGESTTFLKLLKENHLFHPLKEFGRQKPIFGTCAGLITLASQVENYPQETLNLIDISVERNAYGRQIDSFIDVVEVNLNNDKTQVEGVFIRAPKIKRVGEKVKALAFHGKDIVMAENEHILVATFHPELTDDLRIHKYFLEKIKSS